MNRIKRIICFILLLTTMITCFTTYEAEHVSAKSDINKLNKKAHKAFMGQVKADKEKYLDRSGGTKLKYIFIDLDGDNVDELITYPGYGVVSQIIYDLKNGAVIEVETLSQCEIQSFYAKTKVIYTAGAHMGTFSNSYYKISKGIMKNVALENGYWYDQYDNLLEKPSYETYINGEKVSRAKYQKFIKSLKKGKKKDFSKIKWKEY